MKKKICILYTGGTIGMVPTKEGFAPKPGYFATLLQSIHELHTQQLPDWDLVEFTPLLDSSNIAVKEWNRIGRAIRDRYTQYDGFVVLHGTDTMAYTASALSFMLENLGKPVILTGSQIPLGQLRSDARDNLITSLFIATNSKIQQVCLYFAGQLLRGNRATKTSSDGLIAFESPNAPLLATAGIEIQYQASAYQMPWKKAQAPFALTELKETPIGVLKIFPGIQFDLFAPVLTKNLRGIVLESFGSGNIPSNDSILLPIIAQAFENGAIVTVCSQCLRGTVHLGAYATSSQLSRAGAVCGYDMTTEAAVAKLYYLFSLDLPVEEIKKRMEQDLRGEMTR